MLEYIVDGQIIEVDPKDKNLFLQKYPNAKEQKKDMSPDFQTPTTPGAVVEETAAPDMESKSDPGSGELQKNEPFRPVFSKTGQILNKPKVEKIGNNKDFEEFNFLEETGKKIKRSAISIGGGINRIPTFLNEFKYAAVKGIINHGYANVPSLFENAKKNIDKFDELSAESQQQTLNNIFDQLPGSLKAKEGLKKYEESIIKAEEIENKLTQFDNTIGQAFAQGDIGEATARVVSEAIGSLPFMLEAMVPVVGIPLIVGQEAARASGEAQKEGDKINLKLMGYSAVIGASEGLLEITTKRIGKTMFKELFNKSDEVVKKSIKQMALQLVKDAGAEGLSESATLTINNTADALIRNDEKAFEGYFLELIDTFLIGATSGAGPSSLGKGATIIRDGIGNRAVNKSLKKANIKEISEAFADDKITDNIIELSRNQFSEKALNTELNDKVRIGDLTLDKSNEIKLNFKNAQAAVKLADNIKIAPSLINETVNLIQERNKLSNTVKQAGENKALVSEESNRLKEIDARLAEISKENISIRLDEKIEKLEKPIKEPGSLLSDPFGIVTAADKIRQTKLEKAKEQKFSNEVQEIYNEKGEAGALDIIEKFKPITNKLVRKRKDAPNYDEQLLRDEIETGERGIFDLIRSYKPDSGVPLSGYINKFLKARAIEASNRVLGKEFTQDVTEIKESKIDLDDTTQETLDFVRTEPKAKEQLRDVAGITKESVQKDATQILKGKLPGIIEKSGRDKNEILTAINNASKLKIADSVLEEMGGNFSNKEEQNSRFITFMDVNFEATMKAIPNSVKNKLPLFEAKQIDRETTTEGDAAGKGIFEYKNPTRDEFVKYYTEGGLTTLRAKKKKLADILAQEIGKDAIAEVLADPKVQKDFLERQELQGKKIPEGAIPKLLERIDRAINYIESTSDKNVLAMDFTLGLVANAKAIVLKFLKSLRKYLANKNFNDAKSQAIKDLNIKNKADFDLVNNVLSDVKESDIQNTESVNKIIEKLKETIKKERIPQVLIDNRMPILIENINSIKNSEFKIKELKNFLNTHTKVFTKAGSTYKKQLKSKYGIEISSNAGFLKFIKSKFPNQKWINDFKIGKGNSIFYKNENLSSIKYNLNNKPRIDLVDGKIDPAEIELRANKNKKSLIKELDIYKERKDFEGGFNMLTAMQEDQNTPLRLYPSLNIVFKPFKGYKNPGELVVEHNPPTDSQIPTFMKYIKGEITRAELVSYMNNAEMNIVSKKFDNEIPTEFKSKESKDRYKHLENYKEGKDYIVYNNKQNHFNEKNLDKEFNDILQNKTGIKSVFRYAEAKAEVAGKDKGKFDYIGIPPSAQDFMGLLYKMIGKGKQGNLQLAWFKKNLLDPFAKAMVEISNTRVALANDFKEIKKIANIAPKVLKNKLPGEPFTVEQAIRVYIWNKQDMDVDGLSKADLKTLVNYVKEDTNLLSFANQLIQINKDMAYPKPDKNWLMGTMTTDLLQGLNTTTRKEALSEWQANVDVIFSQANMNKLEAAFGKGYRSALNNMLQRMQTGRNRGYPGDQLTGRFVDWLNGSVGAIMFFNMRSAVLQTISSVNFINFTDNNPLKAAAAFANQPQYWKDVMFIMNSDYLIERRNGLKINVNEADIAEIAAESKNKAKAFVNKLLKLGFLPTQIADSFAIATGGASFYRNRVKSYIKKGLSEKEAQDKAFLDFREITEENQQSSRPDRISQQQAGPLGRIILAFANTPAQYARIIQRAASDLKNGRGDAKTNISKIIYYGAIQNVIFNAMQQALFAIAFGDEEPDDEKEAEKYGNIVNGMVDSLLRGTGFAGAAVSTVKNAIIKIAKDGNKQDIAIDLINISPPISSKIRKVRSAGRTFDWNKKEIKEKGLSLDNPAAMAIGQLVSATTNVPLDRGIKKLTNIKDALDTENEEWMRIANALGWSKWELEWEQDKRKKKDTGRKEIERTNINRKNITREQIKRN